MVKSLFKFLRNSLVNPFNLRNGLELPKEVDSSETSKKEPEMYVYVQIDRTNETKKYSLKISYISH